MWFITIRRRPLLLRVAALAAACALIVAGQLAGPSAGPAQPASAPGGAAPVSRVDGPEPRVALTFDVTYGEQELSEVLRALDADGARATFFVSHLWVGQHPELLQQLVAGGHEVGTLGLKFIDLTRMEEPEITAQLTTAQGLLFRILARPVRLFRPPMGRWDGDVVRAAREAGLQTVTWRVDAGDGITPPPPARQVAANVVQHAERGDIIRLHASDFARTTAEALPLILQGLRQQGLKVVPVRDLMP